MPEPREYTVEKFDPWIDRETGDAVKDPHGNIKGSVLFVEDKSEPIDATFKTMPNAGDKKYGVVDLYLTKAGKSRKGFKRADRPDDRGTAQAGQVAQAKYPRNDEATQESIARSVALKAAVDYVASWKEASNSSDILAISDKFLAWLQGNAPAPQPASGYDKAKAVAQNLRRDDRDEDNDLRSMMNNSEPYPEDDLPPEYR